MKLAILAKMKIVEKAFHMAIGLKGRLIDGRIMFRVFDVPSMASSVCVDTTFSKNGDGKVCFWYLTKWGNSYVG